MRMAIAPDAQHDLEVLRHVVVGLTESRCDAPLHAAVDVEARCGELFRAFLLDAGWGEGERWTPLSRDLAEPVEDCGLRIELTGPDRADVRVAVQRAAFDRSTFTDESWRTMASGVPYADARCLVCFDDEGAAVAAATVWSAGRGRPGLIEPLGVHREHRGRGYGVAITIAAAGALRELGSSSAIVCTETSNVGAVATYLSAGFRQHPQVRDLRRPTDEAGT